MRPWIWLRGLAVDLAIFAAGHTLGTAIQHVTRGPRQAAVFTAMQSFSFTVMGFNRTYWDFYRGFALIISLQLLVMSSIAWQYRVAVEHDEQARLAIGPAAGDHCAARLCGAAGRELDVLLRCADPHVSDGGALLDRRGGGARERLPSGGQSEPHPSLLTAPCEEPASRWSPDQRRGRQDESDRAAGRGSVAPPATPKVASISASFWSKRSGAVSIG